MVYTALDEAGISGGELDARDTTLDKEIIATQGMPQPPGHAWPTSPATLRNGRR